MDKGIAVYCASSDKIAQTYFDAARRLGHAIATAGMPLIDGAGRIGLMGAVNDACLDAGGCAIGVIPAFMVELGLQHDGLTELHVVRTMHERKAKMASLARGVIALPGGIGTFEELTEIMTWLKLGLFDGRVAVLNTGGYYDPFLAMLDRAASDGFIDTSFRTGFLATESVDEALRFVLS